MAELDAITKLLERQRQDLEIQLAETTSRSDETADLLNRIQELQRRADDTHRRFLRPAGGAEPKE